MKTICQYEYAGFVYNIVGGAEAPRAVPVSDEHPSAWKPEHREAALAAWREDSKHQREQLRGAC